MAAERRGQPELHVRLPARPPASPLTALPELPPIAALFLIEFDVKAGYTLSWKASQPDIELEGVVEYKSLPSGLHTVSDDLIYFVHDRFAGLSAFVNAPVEDSEVRNARMLAVGVLVPLSYGRLGRAWRHAEGLKDMATKMITHGENRGILEQYWEKNQARDENVRTQQAAVASKEMPDSPAVTFQAQSKPHRRQGHARIRSASDGHALLPPGHKLSPFHPAWSLTALLDTFGPMIFPIHRAALLRKRILISCHAPVREVCNFVYDISILSNIPLTTYEVLHPGCPSHRLRPLFTIGVHDIPFLLDDAKPARPENQSADRESEAGTGWIVCTTDSILAMKDTLWDMLITMPPSHASAAKVHQWPTVECPRGSSIKATQRDLRRFRALKAGLSRMQSYNSTVVESPSSIPPTPRNATRDEPLLDEAEQIVEPLSWAALAYNGFMWWASAGEKARSDEAEETSQDASLLADFILGVDMSGSRSADLSTSVTSLNGRRSTSTAANGHPQSPDEARTELAIIAYFHRLTTQILTKATDVVESHSDCEDAESNVGDDEEPLLEPGEEEFGGRGLRIGSDTLREMGLDIWSTSDAEFVKELVRVYFDRRAFVEGKGVEVCGVRVC